MNLALKEKMRIQFTFWKSVFYIILILGIYSTYLRFFHGLGVATHLSDKFPWGLWIGFDVLCGVGLAAGGFTMAALVYIFNIKKFRPIIRPAILTAFLGYLLVIVALLFDLGRPYRIWHPLIMWNPHSVMFEVAWCVTLYTIVLALEFSPVVFEKFRMEKPLRIIKNVSIVLVILGVILSTLHQSSLGSLFLIVPEKLYPLWYSPILPLHFFFSSVAVGFAMVIFESYLSSRAFNKHLEKPLLVELARVVVFVLSLYLVLKVLDFADHNKWHYLFVNRIETYLFWAETLVGVIGPIILLSINKVRRNHLALFWSVLMVVIGFVMNRLNVSITGMEAYTHANYFPSWMEISITLMLVSLGFAAFGLIAKHFPIFEPSEPIPVESYKPIPIKIKEKKEMVKNESLSLGSTS